MWCEICIYNMVTFLDKLLAALTPQMVGKRAKITDQGDRNERKTKRSARGRGGSCWKNRTKAAVVRVFFCTRLKHEVYVRTEAKAFPRHLRHHSFMSECPGSSIWCDGLQQIISHCRDKETRHFLISRVDSKRATGSLDLNLFQMSVMESLFD